jgi:hypothetical protein
MADPNWGIPQATIDEMRRRLRRSPLSPLVAAEPAYPNNEAQRTYVMNAVGDRNKTGIGPPPESLKRANPWLTELPEPSELLLPDAEFDKVAAKIPGLKKYLGRPEADRRKVWLDCAKQHAERKYLFGYCNLFSMITVGILVAANSPLPPNLLVEWFAAGYGATGHMTVVINRGLGSEESDPDTWGDHYLMIDYWYALQLGVEPLFRPRTRHSIEEKRRKGIKLDAHDDYRNFLDGRGRIKRVGSFRACEYSERIREKEEGKV